MTLDLRFSGGKLTGGGSDEVGRFLIHGGYDLETRACWWTKSYSSHRVAYDGVQEGKRIHGEWTIRGWDRGSFSIWPGGEGALTSEFFLTETAPEPEVAEAYSTTTLSVPLRP